MTRLVSLEAWCSPTPSWVLRPSCLKPPAQWLRWVWGQGTLPASWQLSQQLRNGFTEE